ARTLSSDNITLARELIKQFNDKNNQNSALLLNSLSRERAIISLLSLEKIHARIAGGLQLEDGRRRQSITPMVEVWSGEHWELFDLQTGREGKPDNILLWNQEGHSLLDVIGGRNSNISFSIIA
ncbi:gonadoliberin III, partial [Vibrio natriegens]